MKQHEVTVAATFTFTMNGLSRGEIEQALSPYGSLYESTKARLMDQGFEITDITEVGT